MSRLNLTALRARRKFRRAKYAGSRVSGFDQTKARVEDRRRAPNLRRAAPGLKGKVASRARELAERLSYGDGPAPATLASSACYHAVREPLLDHLVRLANKPKWAPVVLAVLLPGNAYVAPGKLKRFVARRFLERLRADLRWAKAMSARGWLLATVHGEFNETRNGWNPHYHLAAAGPQMIAALQRLRKKRKYRLIPGVPDRIRSDKAHRCGAGRLIPTSCATRSPTCCRASGRIAGRERTRKTTRSGPGGAACRPNVRRSFCCGWFGSSSPT